MTEKLDLVMESDLCPLPAVPSCVFTKDSGGQLNVLQSLNSQILF